MNSTGTHIPVAAMVAGALLPAGSDAPGSRPPIRRTLTLERRVDAETRYLIQAGLEGEVLRATCEVGGRSWKSGADEAGAGGGRWP